MIGAHPNFVDENLRGRPVNAGVVVVHAVYHERAASADVVDRVICDCLRARRLNLSTRKL